MKLRPRAPIVWTPEGIPYAEQFGDVYYSRHGGLAETHAVFLEPLGLPERWRGRRKFILGELGFGAGLNALAVWDLWARTRDPGAVLHFISIEGFPMESADAARAMALFPELSDRARRLLERWPCRATGLHRRWFPEDGFCLTLIHEEASAALDLIAGPVDGWLLDGFAPAKNPDMWSEDIFARIARASAPGAKAATYSVAGAVRRGLAKSGFEVHRAPGFALKRERIEAEFKGANACPECAPATKSAIVIGGGIAGACAAAGLMRRGIAVTLIEADGLASGGSGNPAGIVSPRLDAGDDPAARFLRAAYLYAADFYRAHAPEAFHATGLIRAEEDAHKAARVAADPPLPEDWLAAADPAAAGLDAEAAYRLPQAGLLEPARAIGALVQGCRIITGRRAARLEPAESGWRACDESGAEIAAADVIIAAAGAGIAAFAAHMHLPVRGRRGALSVAPYHGPDLPPASGGAYAFSMNQELLFGATFDPAELDAPVEPLSAADHARNHAGLAALSPPRAAALPPQDTWRGRAAMRVTTPDHLPIAGALPDWTALAPILEALGRGALDRTAVEPPRQTGLFLLAGLGARGLTTAPLLGESVAALAAGEAPPLPQDQLRALDPARFVLRAAQRGR